MSIRARDEGNFPSGIKHRNRAVESLFTLNWTKRLLVADGCGGRRISGFTSSDFICTSFSLIHCYILRLPMFLVDIRAYYLVLLNGEEKFRKMKKPSWPRTLHYNIIILLLWKRLNRTRNLSLLKSVFNMYTITYIFNYYYWSR